MYHDEKNNLSRKSGNKSEYAQKVSGDEEPQGYIGILDEVLDFRESVYSFRIDCFLLKESEELNGLRRRNKGQFLSWLISAKSFLIEFEVNAFDFPGINFKRFKANRWMKISEAKSGISGVITETSTEVLEDKRNERQNFFEFPKSHDGRNKLSKSLMFAMDRPFVHGLKYFDVQEQLSSSYNKIEKPFGLGVYNVGQGNCNAVVSKDLMPMLYFDLGAGCGRNATTLPNRLKFCFTHRPMIVLSHWHEDHWYGARIDTRALDYKWLVPTQAHRLRPGNARFAADIQMRGNLVIIPPNFGSISLNAGLGRLISCTGRGVNHSGIALWLKLQKSIDKSDTYHILAPGDADFQFIPGSQNGVHAFVAPHHGSGINPNSIPRSLGPALYAASYGFNNSYNHPSIGMQTIYQNAGWITRLDTIKGGILLSPSVGLNLPSAPKCNFKKCNILIQQN